MTLGLWAGRWSTKGALLAGLVTCTCCGRRGISGAITSGPAGVPAVGAIKAAPSVAPPRPVANLSSAWFVPGASLLAVVPGGAVVVGLKEPARVVALDPKSSRVIADLSETLRPFEIRGRVDVRDGWTITTPPGALFAGEGVLVAFHRGGAAGVRDRLVGLRMPTGRVAWQVSTPFDPRVRAVTLVSDASDRSSLLLVASSVLPVASENARIVESEIAGKRVVTPATVRAIDARTGDERWVHELNDGGGWVARAAQKRVLFAVQESDTTITLAALDAKTGRPLWSRLVPARDKGSWALEGDRVMALSDDRLVTLDGATGTERFRIIFPPGASGERDRWSGPFAVAWQERVVLLTSTVTFELVAIDLDSGAVRWRRTGFDDVSLSGSDPIAHESLGPLVALDKSDGRTQWAWWADRVVPIEGVSDGGPGVLVETTSGLRAFGRAERPSAVFRATVGGQLRVDGRPARNASVHVGRGLTKTDVVGRFTARVETPGEVSVWADWDSAATPRGRPCVIQTGMSVDGENMPLEKRSVELVAPGANVTVAFDAKTFPLHDGSCEE